MAVSNESVAISMALSEATRALGDKGRAMRWLGTPVRALNFETPISLITTSEGLERVMDVLGQMEHGIW